MLQKSLRTIATSLFIGLLLLASGVSANNGNFDVTRANRAQGATIIDVNREGCVVTVTFTVQDAATYGMQIFDDGNLEDFQLLPATAGQTIVAQHVIDYFVLQGVAGIGIYIVNEAGTVLFDFVDPFNVPSDVQQSCAQGTLAGGAPCLPLTSNAVVGRIQFDTAIYWAPGKVSPGLTINAANTQTLWVLGVDESGEYYKVLLACQYLWLPVGSIGPNFDNVWQGRPLPTTVVS
jgi:hypothetical protein